MRLQADYTLEDELTLGPFIASFVLKGTAEHSGEEYSLEISDFSFELTDHDGRRTILQDELPRTFWEVLEEEARSLALPRIENGYPSQLHWTEVESDDECSE